MPLTPQELYDAALFGIRKQDYRVALGRKYIRPDGVPARVQCSYLAENGDRCALGHAFGPEMPESFSLLKGDVHALLADQDTRTFVREVIGGNTDLAYRLQLAHDTTLHNYGSEEWEVEMQCLAREWTEKGTPIRYTPVESK